MVQKFKKNSVVYYTKARSLLELALLRNPKNPKLWVESIRFK